MPPCVLAVSTEGLLGLSLFQLAPSVPASHRQRRLRGGAMAAVGRGGVLWRQAAGWLWAARAAAAAPPGARAGKEQPGTGGPRRAAGWAASLRPTGCEGTAPFPAGPVPTPPHSSSFGSDQGSAAWALPTDGGGAGGRRQEVQHAGRGLPALP